MSPVLVRLSLVAAGAGLLCAAQVAGAATSAGPKVLSFTDESGDSLGVPGDDITKVTWTTTGKKVGKTYTPKNLVISLDLASAVGDGTVQYNVEGAVGGCSFFLYATPGAALSGDNASGACSEDDTVDLGATWAANGSRVTFTLPLGATPDFKAGKSVSGLYAYTGTVDPVTGEIGNTLPGSTPLDNDQAESDKSYKIG